MKFRHLPASPVGPDFTYQFPGEFGALWDHVANIVQPRTVVEIGSLYGGTLWAWLQVPGVRSVTSVDLLLDYEPMRPGLVEARKQWQGWSNRLHIVEGDSHAPETVRAVSDRTGARIDFLFIDGDHTYEGVSADFAAWSPLVRRGGLVAFHDTVPTDERHEPGVVQLVTELERRYLSLRFFEPGGAGITAFVL